MIVKTFEEFINEGLWGNTILRSKGGKKRIEDDILENSNLYELESVDIGLPFYFASDDLMIDDETVFTIFEYGAVESKIEKTGWRLPTKEDMKVISDMVKSNDKKYFYHARNFDDFQDTWIVTYKPTNIDLEFVVSVYTEYMLDKFYSWKMSNYEDNKCLLLPNIIKVSDEDYYKIRLIKDKK